MITKRKGNGQTECYGCKQKGKFALNWDSFLYTFDDKPYCFDCLMEKLEQLYQKNQELKEKIETYEDPKDLTLMFMYCDEKAKDKIRELKKQLEDKEERLERLRISAIGHAKRELDLENQQKEFIEYMEEKIICYENHQNTNLGEYERNLYFDIYNDILEKYKEIIGNDINVGSIGGKDDNE